MPRVTILESREPIGTPEDGMIFARGLRDGLLDLMSRGEPASLEQNVETISEIGEGKELIHATYTSPSLRLELIIRYVACRKRESTFGLAVLMKLSGDEKHWSFQGATSVVVNSYLESRGLKKVVDTIIHNRTAYHQGPAEYSVFLLTSGGMEALRQELAGDTFSIFSLVEQPVAQT